MDQLPVYLYDPISDYVNAELKKKVRGAGLLHRFAELMTT